MKKYCYALTLTSLLVAAGNVVAEEKAERSPRGKVRLS